jgi:hypothetical protein
MEFVWFIPIKNEKYNFNMLSIMTTYNYNDLITVENYYNFNKKLIKIEKLDVINIFNDDKFVDSISMFDINNDDHLLLLSNKFPLLKLLNVDDKLWDNYDYCNILDINDLSLKDLKYCNNNEEFLQNQTTIMRFFFNNIKMNNNNNNRLILFLSLLDFSLKTIKLNNKSLNKTIQDKIMNDKNTLLKIINNDIYNKIYTTFGLYSS